jgi:membrane-associated protease RseP (regulator of RpoE activity)
MRCLSPTTRLHRAALGLLVLLLPLAASPAPAAPAAPAAADTGPPRLGVQVQPMTPELRTWFNAPEGAGVLVARVELGSPAAAAGVQVGDVIVEAGGEAVESPRDLIWQALRAPEGEKLKVALLRKGERLELEVVPRGKPHPPIWERDDLWGPGQGGGLLRDLREQLHKLEKRIEELEQRLDENVDRT